jgi:hypothetical protein
VTECIQNACFEWLLVARKTLGKDVGMIICHMVWESRQIELVEPWLKTVQVDYQDISSDSKKFDSDGFDWDDLK